MADHVKKTLFAETPDALPLARNAIQSYARNLLSNPSIVISFAVWIVIVRSDFSLRTCDLIPRACKQNTEPPEIRAKTPSSCLCLASDG